ncbi:hypothetical protein BCR36DRAFT_584687 [Piromyces finnis]|uniref:Extracellular metalloproteinase n=1 Tax=Piromyces finnis TaxID=1754191 RepID=A0A1Y1V584_9FUNG|nr:hypothetical protein BCR36DRAFT_584687 [Piromyces finnis]|eukprot:ORX47592.1 hypothetical protein BCR36DRAFT_584687 [Piromyces finnis]
MLLKKTLILSMLSIVFANEYKKDSFIQNAMKKLNIEDSSLFPETKFDTYEFQNSPELHSRSFEEDYIDGKPVVIEIEKEALEKRNFLNSTEIAKQFMNQNYPNIEYIFTDIIDGEESTIASIHMAQAINGVEVRNSAINVNIDTLTGNIISSGVSIWDNLEIVNSASKVATMDLTEAINIVVEQLDISKEPIDLSSIKIEKSINKHLLVSGIPFTFDNSLLARKVYIASKENKAEQVWELTLDLETDYIIVFISIDNRQIINFQDLTNHATYRVVPINSPNIGSYSRVTYKDPFYKESSPLGWHNNNNKSFTDTRGNNVLVYENSDGNDSISGNKPISGGKNLMFEFTYNDSKKKVEENQNAAAANAFYVCNMLHDIFYKLGFDEANGNFQTTNFSGKGQGNDPVIVRVSDRSGENNAQMSVSIDGVKPILKLFPFYNKNKNIEKDPAFDNQIIIHEYSHGVSNRMIGGPSNSKCLYDTTEAQQLNEGYSDFFADAMQFRENINRNTLVNLFSYVIDGARKYPITSNTKYNNLKYSNLNSDVYLGSEVWSVMLHEVFWNFVEAYKNDPDYLVTNKNLSFKPSNFLVLNFVIQSFKLMPCNPTFIQARDSFILAIDSTNGSKEVRTKMKCLAWVGFAKRGLGYNAKKAFKKGAYTNDFTVPSECTQYKNF